MATKSRDYTFDTSDLHNLGIKTSREIAVRGRSSFKGSRTYTKDILDIPQDCEATILDIIIYMLLELNTKQSPS